MWKEQNKVALPIQTIIAKQETMVSKTSKNFLISSVAAAAALCCVATARADALSFKTADGQWTLGGALRFRYDYLAYGTPRVNKFSLDTFYLTLQYDSPTWFFNSQYRFYGGSYPYAYAPYGKVNFPRYAYVGYKLSKTSQVQAGLNWVPFGIQPLVSDSWLESVGNVVGLEDEDNFGVKYENRVGALDYTVAFYPTSGGIWNGTSNGDSYSLNVVPADSYVTNGSQNKERNKLVGRVTYALPEVGSLKSTLGASVMYSTLYNYSTMRNGHRNAEDIDYSATYKRFNLQAEVARQNMAPENPSSIGNSTVSFGAFDGTFNVASKGTMYTLNLGYSSPLKFSQVSEIHPYLTYSTYNKSEPGFLNTTRVLLGVSSKVGPIYVQPELEFGKNDPYIGDYTQGAGAGGANRWNKRLYINFGYYF
jgi:hypothetical protein